MAKVDTDPAVVVIAKAFAEAWSEHPKNTAVDAHVAVSALTQEDYVILPKDGLRRIEDAAYARGYAQGAIEATSGPTEG